MVVLSDGRLSRSTSSRRYKTAIHPLDDWRWLLDLSPVTFESCTAPGTRRYGGLTAEDVATRLAARRIRTSSSPYKTSYARVAAGIMNTPEEIDTVLKEIRALAGA